MRLCGFMNPIIHLLTQTHASCCCVLTFKWHFASPDGTYVHVCKLSALFAMYGMESLLGFFAHCNQLLGTPHLPHADSDCVWHMSVPSSSSVISWVVAACNVRLGLQPWNECTETDCDAKCKWDIRSMRYVICGVCNMWHTVQYAVFSMVLQHSIKVMMWQGMQH